MPILCEVLAQRIPDLNNEDIVDALDLPADARTIPVLAAVVNDYPEWPEADEYGATTAVKAIQALKRIAAPEAINSLSQAAQNEHLREATSENVAVREALKIALQQ